MGLASTPGIIDDFVTFLSGTVISTASAAGIKLLQSTDGGTAFVEGTVPGLAAGANAATDNHMEELSFDRLMLRAQEGEIGFEVRAKVSVATTLALNIGLNDDALEDSNTLPVELSGTTWTTNSATFIGVCYDVDSTNDDVHMMWVDDDNDSTQALADLRMTGVNPAAGEFFKAGVQVTDAGSGNQCPARAWFETAGGKYGEKAFKATIDRDAAMVGYTGWENRDAVAHTISIQYMHQWASLAI